MDRTDLLERLLSLFEREGIRYCIIGGLAVNAYVEPVVTLDLDVAIAPEQVDRTIALLGEAFEIEHFPHSVNLSAPGSSLRVQIQKDSRYSEFVQRASLRTVLEHPLPVAALPDVLQGKIWAASDDQRRTSKRQKDLADIARLIETYPELRARVPASLLEKLL
ncbi:MAG TPA: nucleotidyl transferase AbiEii/AbiGii toxin family protein [Thermoanaerobaculia bacterium]|nr:nucleotidyl transferase AbiEii/AbiGii toxin family protein [Thermoanaerobaculia bacterium]